MNRRHHRELERWLVAEATDDDVRAESALTRVFARLPRLAPPPEFVDRVMAAAPMAVRRATPMLWAWRWSIGAALVLMGLATGLLPALRWLPFDVPRLNDVVKAGAMTLGSVAEWLQAGLAVWAVFGQIGRLVGVTIQAPEVAAALAGSALVSTAALYTLNHLLTLERRSG